MDNSNSYEREIDLKDLMFAVLHRWRLLLAAGVAMALVLGGYKGVFSAYKGYDSEADQKYEKELELYEQKLENSRKEINNLTEDIEKQQEYLDKSVYVNMSPYNIWEAKASFFVETDYEIMPGMTYQNKDYTATVLQSYEAALNDVEFMERLAEKTGTEVRYLKELMSISIGRSDEGYNNLLNIQVRHGEEEKARELVETLADEIFRSTSRISSKIKKHTVTQVSMSLGTVVDLNLADRQRNERTQLENLTNSLSDKQDSLEEQEKEKPEMAESRSTLMIKGGIKYSLIGGVLGIFAAAFCICIGFVMSDKVSSAKELKYRFQIRILGAMPLGADKKSSGTKKLNPIDAWLNRLEGRAGNKDVSREYDLAAVNILNYVEGSGSIFVSGGASEDKIKDAAKHLAERLNGIEVISGRDFLSDPESLKQLAECQSVVLVEQCGKSTYGNTQQEIEKITELHKKLAGCIIFE